MKGFSISTLILLIFSAAATFGQNRPEPQPTRSPEGEEVVKITTKLVQIDAVVIDKDGHQIVDLKEGDFEILQDGKPQKITNVSYVNTGRASISKPVAQPGSREAIPTPPASVKSSDPGRIITFIVDDGNCSATITGIEASKAALKKFVNEQMLSNDRIAIYKTRAGSSTLQQYLSDKTLLLRSIDKIRWYPPTGGCSFNDGSQLAAKSNILDKISPTSGMTQSQIESDDDRKTRESSEDFNRNNQINGTIGVINYVIRGLERVGGRKIVFFMSDGLQLRSRSGEILSAAEALRDVAELANRAAVVFDTIDIRGVYSTSIIEAQDEVRTLSDVNASDKVISTRETDVRLSQDGLYYLADATGGEFYKNTNKLDIPIKRTLGQEEGYYLLAYEPSDDTFRDKRYNKIEVSVKRPNLKVRSRAGFYGTVDRPVKPTKHGNDSDLYEAIASPLPNAGLDLQLTAYFGNTIEEGNFVRSLIYVPGEEITFVDDTGNLKKAVFDVAAVTLNEKNQVVDEFTRTHTFKIEAAALPFIKKNGLIYSTDIPVKKAGTYNFRVAVRDASSRLLGSSSQVVEIPDLKKTGVFLSGLTVSAADANGKFAIPSQVKPENALAMTNSASVPAIRQFHRGSVLAYSYTIYNAELDKATQRPNVLIQAKLFHNGELVSNGQLTPAKFDQQADWSRISDYSYLRLNPTVEPGDYTLQLIVKDDLSSGNKSLSSQWIDFEVVP